MTFDESDPAPNPTASPDLARSLAAAQHKLRLAEDWCGMLDQLVDMSDAYTFDDRGGPGHGGMIPGGLPDPMAAYSRSLIYPGATAWAYINELELRQIRARSRVFAQTNPYAIGAGRNRVAYAVGSGHTYKVLPRDPDEADEKTLEDCRTVLDDFRKRNKWAQRQKETVRRLDRDGERFLRIFTDADKGELNVRFVEPLEIQNPPGETSATGCYFGIGFKKVGSGEGGGQPVWDIETPEWYYVVNLGTLGEVIGLREKVPAKEMQHLKINVDMTWPRGLPTWFALQTHLYDAVRTLKATGKIVEFRARIGMIRRHVNAAQQSVQVMVDAMKAGANGPSGVNTAGKYPWAAIIDTSDATEYQFPSGTVPVDGNVAAIQAELRAAAAALGMPEYMLSGDASNANYSSTMVAEGPAVKTFEEMQADLIDADTAILEGQLVVAAAAGLIEGCGSDEDADDYILDLVKVEAEPPIIKSEDRLKEAQADQILFNSKIMSKETFAARHGLVWADEQDKIEIEGEEETGYGVDDLPPTLPLMGPDGKPLPPQQPQQPGQPPMPPAAGGKTTQQEDYVIPPILEVPDIRQTDHYSCGAAAAMCAGRYFGVGPETLPAWKKALGTDVQESTRPQAIVDYLQSLGLQADARSGMTLDDLAANISAGRPVIVCVQDYGPYVPAAARFNYGHYLTVIGMLPGYVICQDSSEDNVLAGSGVIDKPGRVIIGAEDFLKAWHDKDIDGNEYVQFGIAVGR